MSNDVSKLDLLKNSGDAPEWLTEEGLKTLNGGYLLKNETPKEMYVRVAKAASAYYQDADKWYEKFFDCMWKNWLCPASPILSNLGTNRGLPISCNSVHVGDSINSIFVKNHELAILSKNGAGVGIYCGDIRGRGASINGNGSSEGVIPWIKCYDATTIAVSQGSTRRGASAVYLPVEHSDIDEFINIRKPTGDINRRCLNLNHGVCISDDWMNSMLGGDSSKREIWQNILSNRVTTGEPYMFFTDNANKQNPKCYIDNGLSVKTSNICCLSGDTLVLTKNGPERIDSLVGKNVEIFDGENWVENDTFELRGHDALTRIHLKDGTHIDSNDMHRWFVSSTSHEIRNKKHSMIYTKDLVVGQYLEYHMEETHGNHEESGAYIKGFMLGDGTSTKGRPLLRLHSTKYSCMEELIKSANELMPDIAKTNAITDIHFSHEYDYTNCNKAYGTQLLKNMCGLSVRRNDLIEWATNHKKKLPNEVYSWNKTSKIKLIAGILDSDGTIGKHYSIQVSSIHKCFLESLQLLLKTLGISSGIECNVERASRLTISSYDGYHLLKIMDCKRLKYDGLKPNRKSTGWRKIVKIEKLEGIHPVYCPTLPTTGKFALSCGVMTGNTEIFLHTDKDHSFVCCLSSLNLVRWHEWKDTDLPNVAVRFLDAVIEEYIRKTENMSGMECSRASAIKGRAVGVGVLGWHTLLQESMISFDSFDAMVLNGQIFKSIREKTDVETEVMAKELGEPEWCVGHGRRNTHTIAIAPTVSNSTISGGYSAGIEPISSNIFSQKSAKGTFIRKNKTLEKILEKYKKNNHEVWKSINEYNGSVQHLDFLSSEEKSVFLTAREINQHAIIKQASQRQKWVDQGQSINLFFSSNSDPKYIHEVHVAAWKGGLKSLYYFRSEGVIRGDLASRSSEECAACEA